jgi:hypothetical protein
VPPRADRGARFGDPGGSLPSQRTRLSREDRFDYGPGAIVRRVDEGGWLSFRNRPLKLGRAFSYRRVALRATEQDGCFDVIFCAHKVGALG